LLFDRSSPPVVTSRVGKTLARALCAKELADKLFDDAIAEHVTLIANAPSLHDVHTFATRQPEELTLLEDYAFHLSTTSVASLYLPRSSSSEGCLNVIR